MDEWTCAGLGLGYAEVGLSPTPPQWLAAGTELRDHVARLLDAFGRVEQIGSSSVVRLLAKPIIDLAVGLTAADDLAHVVATLEADGWIHRGDAGTSGGHVFVLETRPWHRVAHLHAVEFEGEQWSNYLRFRDLLRSSKDARDRYEAVKARLAAQHPDDRAAYTDGKTQIVTDLLADGVAMAGAIHEVRGRGDKAPGTYETISTLVAGDAGAANAATLNGPYGLALGGAGRLLVAEINGNRIRRIG